MMNLSEVFDNAVESLKKNFGTVIIYYLAYILIFSGIFIVSMIIFGIGAAGAALTMSENKSSGITAIGVIAAIAVFIYITVLYSAKIGLIKIGCQDILKQKVKAYDGIKCSFRNILKAAGLIIMEFIICIPVVAVYVFIIIKFIKVYGYGFLYDIKENNTMAIILMFLKASLIFILLILVSVFIYYLLSTLFIFSLQAVTIENKGVFAALGRSFYLIRHNYFRVLGFNVILALTVGALQISLNSFIGLVGGIIYLILRFLNISVDYIQFFTQNLMPLYNLVNFFASVAIYPLGIFATTNMYFSLLSKKEGYDICLKIDNLKQIEGN